MKNKKSLLILLICIVLIGIIALIVNAVIKANKDYTLEKITDRNYFALYKNGKVGVINTSGEIVVKPEYNYIQIPNPTKDVFICSTNNSTIVLNEKQEELFNEYDEVTGIPVTGAIGDIPYEKSVLRYKKGELYGLINMEGKVVTKPEYEKIESVPYKEGEILVQKDR